jgi:4a-hydroxytetrahydrobiopterin dehydratase
MLDDAGIDPLAISSNVWMQDLDANKPLRHAMHIDVSVSKEHAQSRVDAAVAAGGVIVDSSEAPSWWVLADRSGNKVCVVAWPDGARAKKLED